MLKLKSFSLPILLLFLNLCAEENDRAGVYFGASFSPGFSYSVVSTSIEGSSGSFTKMLGSIETGVQLCISKNGYNIHSILGTFSGYYPIGRFLGSITSGYSFTHYVKAAAPSMAFGFEVANYFRMNGFNELPIIPPVQLGFKTGYEIKKHVTCWIGYHIGFENYNYSINKTTIESLYLSNTIRELGKVNVHEFILANELQISLSYLFY
jgi:hypothetical protein